MSTVQTAETIESQTQSVSLHAELPNYAENQRVVAEMSLLDEVAAEAARLAEAQTQPGFRNEQQARQKAQKEIMTGLKNEENA